MFRSVVKTQIVVGFKSGSLVQSSASCEVKIAYEDVSGLQSRVGTFVGNNSFSQIETWYFFNLSSSSSNIEY